MLVAGGRRVRAQRERERGRERGVIQNIPEREREKGRGGGIVEYTEGGLGGVVVVGYEIYESERTRKLYKDCSLDSVKYLTASPCKATDEMRGEREERERERERGERREKRERRDRENIRNTEILFNMAINPFEAQ